jgi:hypothetical protein
MLCQLLVSSENDVMILHVQLDGSSQDILERTEHKLDGSNHVIFEYSVPHFVSSSASP